MRAVTWTATNVMSVGFMDISDNSIEGDVRGVPVQIGTTQTG
jgi:hypothetical protein